MWLESAAVLCFRSFCCFCLLLNLIDCLFEFSLEAEHLLLPDEVNAAEGEGYFWLLDVLVIYNFVDLRRVLHADFELVFGGFFLHFAAPGHLLIQRALDQHFLSLAHHYKINLLVVHFGEL